MTPSRDDSAKAGQGSMETMLHHLREMFGESRAQIFSGERFRIADETARVVAFPHSIEELCEMMRVARDREWRVIPAGAGTWLEMGNRPVRIDLIVSTEKMDRVLEYEPADLTTTVEAGCTLAAFNGMAAKDRQFIPLDPFGSSTMTIGGVIATASSGPLRCTYGTPRDWLVGIRVVHTDGTITQAGGKVVKNVAGYDLCKLYTGSYGSLAVIASMSFKLRALPPMEKTILFFADSAIPLCAFAARITDSDVMPSALELIAPDEELPQAQYTLALRFLNEEETIDSQIEEAKRLSEGLKFLLLNETEATAFWHGYHEAEASPDWNFSLRMTGLPSNLSTMIQDVQRILPKANLRAHAANGIVRIHAGEGWLEDVKRRQQPRKIVELRNLTQARGGQLLLLRAPADILDHLDVWGDVGPNAALMRAVKTKFDPTGLLNPGRFVAGI